MESRNRIIILHQYYNPHILSFQKHLLKKGTVIRGTVIQTTHFSEHNNSGQKQVLVFRFKEYEKLIFLARKICLNKEKSLENQYKFSLSKIIIRDVSN